MNKTKKILVTILVVVISSTTLLGQKNTDGKLAAQYYSNKEYEKAVVYYQKLFDRTKSPAYYVRLLNCFVELEEFKNGEKLIKRQIKRTPYQLHFYTDLGNLYKVAQQGAKSKQAFDKAIKELSPNNQQIIDLANGYLKYKETEYAIQTYQKGRKLLKGTYPFNFELAQVYSAQGDTEEMLNEYLDLLSFQESYIQSVQNALQTTLANDVEGGKKAKLKTLLIKRIQKNAGKKVFSEMLIWVYIQEKNFSAAFVQAKALDKRQHELGKRIVALANLSLENEDYQTAIDCYEYVIDKGADSYYYISSKMELVNVYNQKIIGSNNYEMQDLLNLEKTYNSTIQELGKTASTANLLISLAHLQSFYLHNTEQSIDLLNEVLAIPRLKPHDRARTKIELADVLVFTGEIWEASLLYSQVEKAYKYDQLGEKAKFKNAKISFYTGDFGWAKTQLDVLKASTSKLIANDAMQLSVMITDNIGIDTTEAPLLMFAMADLLAFQNKDKEAMLMLDSLKLGYPNHTIADDILYKRYQINYKLKKYDEASDNLNSIVKDYSFDILADDAIYNLALLYDNQLDDKVKAAEYYKKIMFDYKSSIYVVGSRKRYRELDDEVKIIDIKEDNLTIGNFDGNGKHTIYNINKQISKEGVFENYRLIEGKWFKYNEENKLIKIELYKNGEYVEDVSDPKELFFYGITPD